MFSEPPTPGLPAPDTPPDSSRIRHGPGERVSGPERRESPAGILGGGIRTRLAGGENPNGIAVGILDLTLSQVERNRFARKSSTKSECVMEWDLEL